MNVNKLVRNLGKTLAGRPKTRKSSKRRNNNRRRNNRTRINRALPAAYTSHVRARFNILSRNSNRCIVSGCDLVYAIPATLAESGDTIFTVIPCNPAYWLGTRIARIAPAYQNYRPLQFRVSYIPQVAVTQPGTVFMGTLWDQAAPTQNIQQSLVTSNGGQLTQCYIPADSNVTLGRNLQQNLFKVTGALDTDTCPFIFLAGVRGAHVVPGYFYVTYRYEFKNPIGEAWTFINSGLTTVAALPEQEPTANGTIILLNQAGALGPGTQLDRESDGIFYHGSPVDISDQSNVVYLNNFQTALTTTARSVGAGGVVIDSMTFVTDEYPFTDFAPGDGSTISPAANTLLCILAETDDYYSLTLTTLSTAVPSSKKYHIIPYTNQYYFSILSNGKTVSSIDAEKLSSDNNQIFSFNKPYFAFLM